MKLKPIINVHFNIFAIYMGENAQYYMNKKYK